MAERRMFSKKITNSDAFLDMPKSAQALYFHLNMEADDDGFLNSPRSIMRMCGCSDDDMKLLLSKKFLILFDSGVVVIKHWRINNYIRNDRYHGTQYTWEKGQLYLKDSGAYTTDTDGIPVVDQMDTEVRLGKVSIGKDSIEIDKDSVGKESVSSSTLSGSKTGQSPKEKTPLQIALGEWRKHLEGKGKNLTPQSTVELFRIATNYSLKYGDQNVIDIIKLSIANDYASIVFDRLDKMKPVNPDKKPEPDDSKALLNMLQAMNEADP